MRNDPANKMTARARTVNPAQRRRALGAPSPLRYEGTVDELVAALKPSMPLYIVRPQELAAKAREFNALFPGTVMYAVKCNPERAVLQSLYRAGIQAFDVASIEETRLAARAAPKAKLYFMHPVKAPEAIREAYERHGVRAFVLDTQEELYKILRETDLAPDLELFVRLALPKNGSAAIDFAAKFGAAPDEAARLLGQCRAVSAKLGLCFHVGTQTMDPGVYSRAVGVVAGVIEAAGVAVDVLDIGGGFPVAYPDQVPPPLPVYIKEIVSALHEHGLQDIPLLAEPGRVLVAAAGSLIVRVEQRRGNLLYLNDGTYGGLFDAGGALNTRFPVRMVRPGPGPSGALAAPVPLEPFRFAGPTCDSIDMMEGPFCLPADIRTGDWVEIGNMGAYSRALRSNFNGFGSSAMIALHSRSGKTVNAKGAVEKTTDIRRKQ